MWCWNTHKSLRDNLAMEHLQSQTDLLEMKKLNIFAGLCVDTGRIFVKRSFDEYLDQVERT